jgi:hypothetical protein
MRAVIVRRTSVPAGCSLKYWEGSRDVMIGSAP